MLLNLIMQKTGLLRVWGGECIETDQGGCLEISWKYPLEKDMKALLAGTDAEWA